MTKPTRSRATPPPRKTRTAGKPVLLSGGNPQIAKGDGDGPVREYLAALPGWKQEACRRVDAAIVRAVPDVRKAVRWNSPLYGIEGQGWFLGLHAFTAFIKVSFFRGAALTPPPPVTSKSGDTRSYHVHDDGIFDERLFAAWVKQAAALPGWIP